MTAAIGNGARYLMNNPDVCLDKSKRNNFMHYNEDQGADWRARRFRFANIKKNAINQSRQFDPAFEKEGAAVGGLEVQQALGSASSLGDDHCV